MKKRILLLILFFAAGCARSENSSTLKFSGTLEMTEHSLGAKAVGRLISLSVDEGDEVKQGQLIAALDRFDQTEKDLKRVEQLLAQGGASQQDLEYARLAMDDQRVVSPMDGIVLVKVREVGETLGAGAAVVVVGDRKNLWVRIFVPEGIINKIKMNQTAVLHFDGLEQTFHGHVSFIAPRAEFTPRNVQTSEERITQTFAVKVTLTDPPTFLRPGVACDVVMNLKD